MRRWHWVLHVALVAGVMGVAGCGDSVSKVFPGEAREIVEKADTLELMTLDPVATEGAGTLYGHRIIGSAVVTDAATRERLVRAVFGSLRNDGTASGCIFSPRHGLRATRGGKVVEVLSCFECLELVAYAGGVRTYSQIDNSARDVVEAAVRAAGLPAATGPAQ